MRDADADGGRCEVCRFYTFGDKVTGHCKRNAPVVGKAGFGIWPKVFRHDWCGRFEPDAGEAEGRAIEKVRELIAAEGGEP